MEVLLGLLDWRAGGTNGLCKEMKWNESEASVGRVLAVEVLCLYCFTHLFAEIKARERLLYGKQPSFWGT